MSRVKPRLTSSAGGAVVVVVVVVGLTTSFDLRRIVPPFPLVTSVGCDGTPFFLFCKEIFLSDDDVHEHNTKLKSRKKKEGKIIYRKDGP